MAKIKTPTQVQDKLDEEWGWRIKEISSIKQSVAVASAVKERSLIRAGVPLLYAHWEGFVKAAAETYIEYVAYQKEKYEDLRACFTVHGIKRRLDELAESSNHKRNTEIVLFIQEKITEKSKIPYRRVVDTRSNLNSDVLVNIGSSLGLDLNRYESKFKFIDEVILKKRNEIAHGEYLDVTSERFFEIAREIEGLLRMFKNDILNSVYQNNHRSDSI